MPRYLAVAETETGPSPAFNSACRSHQQRTTQIAAGSGQGIASDESSEPTHSSGEFAPADLSSPDCAYHSIGHRNAASAVGARVVSFGEKPGHDLSHQQQAQFIRSTRGHSLQGNSAPRARDPVPTWLAARIPRCTS